MKKIYLLFIGLVTFCAYNIGNGFSATKFLLNVSSMNDTVYRIIPGADNTYGYDILVKNRLLIHQPHIPGRPGNKGFVNKSEAEKVAGLVIKKMQMGIMPPTIEKRELDSLKIKY